MDVLSIPTASPIDLTLENIDLIKKSYIAIDVETTGLKIDDRIVEIGATLFMDGKVVKSFSSLINAEKHIPQNVSAINHITDSMIESAPSEKDVYKQFLDFIGEAKHGKIIMCAHNAKFDFSFLCRTLYRLGFGGYFRYIDTYGLAMEHIPFHQIENYKQTTVASFYGISISSAHRAGYDAQTCGHILRELCKDVELSIPNQEELEICAYIHFMLTEAGANSKYIRFFKNRSGYVNINVLHSFLKFKITKKGKYIILSKDSVDLSNQISEPCTQNEGGTNNVRIYFSDPAELNCFSAQLYELYEKSYDNMKEYSSLDKYKNNADSILHNTLSLTDSNIDSLLKDAQKRDYVPIETAVVPISLVTRDMVVVNAKNKRVPLSDINYDNLSSDGFRKAIKYWEQGESARKNGRLLDAIKLFDKSRSYGYTSYYMYDSYAIIYRQLKDYDNEIEILDEAISQIPNMAGHFDARRNKAIQLLYKQQQANIEVLKKADRLSKAQEHNSSQKSKAYNAKIILQLDEDGNVLHEYSSIYEAAKIIGVNAKCIRDAANGKQHHAGSFRWKFKDEFQDDN